MKLPIQAQPILRKVSTQRISYGSSMVHPQQVFCIPLSERLASCDWGDKTDMRFCRLDQIYQCALYPASCAC